MEPNNIIDNNEGIDTYDGIEGGDENMLDEDITELVDDGENELEVLVNDGDGELDVVFNDDEVDKHDIDEDGIEMETELVDESQDVAVQVTKKLKSEVKKPKSKWVIFSSEVSILLL